MVVLARGPRQRVTISPRKKGQEEELPRQVEDVKKSLRVVNRLQLKTIVSLFSLLCLLSMPFSAILKNSQRSHNFPRTIISVYPFDSFQSIDDKDKFPQGHVQIEQSVDHGKDRKDARHNRHREKNSKEDTGCSFISEWQSLPPHPTCNTLHEVGFHITLKENPIRYRLEFLDEGGYKQVWLPLMENGDPASFVYKTSDIGHVGHDGDQTDAKIMDLNTASNYVLDIYTYCGSSNLVQLGTGTLGRWIKEKRKTAKPIELLRIANTLAQAVKDIHLYDPVSNLPTVAHADIKASQFLEVSPGNFRLNDFNRAELLTSKDSKTVCPFYMPGVVHQGSKMRSPEEYLENAPQTDKIDVFSLGSLLYHLLVGENPFADVGFKKAKQNILDGIQPKIENYTDPSLVVIAEAIQMCRQTDPKDRPQSREIADFLQQSLNKQQ